MSHRKILMQRLNDMIEAGHYRAKGAPRAAEDRPAPMPRAEPEKRPQESAEVKRGTPSPEAYVQGLAERRLGAVEDGVKSALDAKFKGGKR